MTELLSVVMPTRDRPDALERAARSVLAQDGPLELVVVDDASGDATVAVVDRLRHDDRRVVALRNEVALGPMLARNVGLQQARGELVGFCDDDDEWLPGAARAVVGHLRDHPALGLASSWHLVSHDDGHSVPFRGPLEYGERHLLWQNLIGLPFGVVRRNAFSFEIAFDPDMRTGEDWDLWLRCAQERPVSTLAAVCYRYAQHGGARVTKALDAQIAGRRHFLDKHGSSMTPACRLYHETVLVALASGRRASLEHLARQVPNAPRDAVTVARVLASSSLASGRGIRRGDPGLQARQMVGLVDRQPGSRIAS
jgi:glycosyltransferase involved in cell wall biosynthesis